jgi:hypothetical protein
MKARKICAAVILLSSTVTAVSYAQTYLLRHYTGHECIQRDATTARPYYYGIAARNDSAAIEAFYCPIRITDALVLQDPANEGTFATAVPDTISVVAWVEDFSTVSNVDCYLRICDADETDCVTSDTASSSGSSGAVTQLAFELASSFDLAIAGGQTANIKCDMPAKTGGGDRSAITGYLVDTRE